MNNASQIGMPNQKNVSTVPEYSYAFQFENNFDIKGVKEWIFSIYHLSIYFALIYLLLVYAGQAYMKTRPPYNLRLLLVVWNTCLAIMSLWGSARVVPELYHVLMNFGFRYSMCMDSIYFDSPVTACWIFVFIMSKVAELMDTVFVVLRKQKLMFIHWFHHSSVLVFSFFLVRDRVAMGRWFMSMNYMVHSLMYTYYALRALKIKVPRKIAMFITTSQIAQMVVGFIISILGYHMWYTQEDACLISGRIAKAAIALYSFYFTLFLNYFFKVYIRPRFIRIDANLKKD